MKAISRWLDRFCYNHPVIGNVLVFFLDMFSNGYVSWLFSFFSPLILQGQIWRIISFLFVPTSGYGGMFSILWFAMTTLFYYYIGNALERQWGTARFTVFYGLGVVLNILVGFLMGSTSMYYINMSMFFAFATLYPDLQVLLYGILPLKVKWLAWIDAALFAFDFFPGGHPQLPHLLLGGPDGRGPPHRTAGRLPRQSPDHQLQKGPEAGPGAQGLSPQVRRVRHHRRGRPQHGVPVLLQVQRLLLLLHEAHQRPRPRAVRLCFSQKRATMGTNESGGLRPGKEDFRL